MERKRREIVKGEEENLKWNEERCKNKQMTFFSLFETTEIKMGISTEKKKKKKKKRRKKKISHGKKMGNVIYIPLTP